MKTSHLREDLLDEYALGRVSLAGRRRMEEHLLLCEACRGRLHIVYELIAALRHMEALNNETEPTAPSRPDSSEE